MARSFPPKKIKCFGCGDEIEKQGNYITLVIPLCKKCKKEREEYWKPRMKMPENPGRLSLTHG